MSLGNDVLSVLETIIQTIGVEKVLQFVIDRIGATETQSQLDQYVAAKAAARARMAATLGPDPDDSQ